jgi:iron complex transport system substrate-binding protein
VTGDGPRPRRGARRTLAVAAVSAALVAATLAGWRAGAPPPRPPDAPPRRIVSLVPAATEILFAVGAGPAVVAVGSFDRYPPEVARLPRVGGLLDPDVERILALRPDLVVVYGTQTDLAAQLARARIPAFEYRHGGLADTLETIRTLGARVGHAAEADRVCRSVAERIAAVRRRVTGRARPRTLVVFGRDPFALRNIWASGGLGFLADMLEAAGGTNVFADVPREAVQATSELILARAPEVILELRAEPRPSAQGDEARDLRSWATLSALPAVRRGRIHVLTGAPFVVPGPRLAEAVEAIARTLHPEAFGSPPGDTPPRESRRE